MVHINVQCMNSEGSVCKKITFEVTNQNGDQYIKLLGINVRLTNKNAGIVDRWEHRDN